MIRAIARHLRAEPVACLVDAAAFGAWCAAVWWLFVLAWAAS